MPEKKSYNTTWINQDEPMPSGLCLKCGVGELKQSQFFDGMYCPNCKWQYRRSKFSPKSADKPQDNTEELIFRQQMKEGLKIINENIQKVIEMLKEK